MRPETKKQHLINIKSALVELHDKCGDVWVSNKEFPISELANTYLKSNGNLKGYFVKYAVNELLQTEDSGRSYKFTWKDREHLMDTEYQAKKILSGFLESIREKVLPIPNGNKLRKLEAHKKREFELKNKVYILEHDGTVCEAVISGKFLNFPNIQEVRYKVMYK